MLYKNNNIGFKVIIIVIIIILNSNSIVSASDNFEIMYYLLKIFSEILLLWCKVFVKIAPKGGMEECNTC